MTFKVLRKAFIAAREDCPGLALLERFQAVQEETARWYLAEGQGELPTASECRHALSQHMPELVAHYDDACAMVGDDDLAHRILSHYLAAEPRGAVRRSGSALAARPSCATTTILFRRSLAASNLAVGLSVA